MGKFALLAACAAYILSPVDLMPEALLGPLGLADDAIVGLVGLRTLFKK